MTSRKLLNELLKAPGWPTAPRTALPLERTQKQNQQCEYQHRDQNHGNHNRPNRVETGTLQPGGARVTGLDSLLYFSIHFPPPGCNRRATKLRSRPPLRHASLSIPRRLVCSSNSTRAFPAPTSTMTASKRYPRSGPHRNRSLPSTLEILSAKNASLATPAAALQTASNWALNTRDFLLDPNPFAADRAARAMIPTQRWI